MSARAALTSSSPPLAPWRALCGALEAAEVRVEQSVQPRLRALPRASTGPLTPEATEQWALAHRALSHAVAELLDAIAASPLAPALPAQETSWGASCETIPLVQLRAALRRVGAPVVHAARAVPELERERWALRYGYVLHRLLVGCERLTALPIQPSICTRAGDLARTVFGSRTART